MQEEGWHLRARVRRVQELPAARKCPKKGWTLDRINNANLDYAPHLCRWASKKQQNTNKGDSIILTIDGVAKTLVQWAEETGQKPDTLRRRRGLDWTDREIVFGRAAIVRGRFYHSHWESLLPTQHARLAERFEEGFLLAAKGKLRPLQPHQYKRSHRVLWLQSLIGRHLRRLAERCDEVQHDHHFNGGPEFDSEVERQAEVWWDLQRHLRDAGYFIRYAPQLF